MPEIRLFVYGTLKRGLANAERMHGARLEGAATTAAGHALYVVRGYPALVAVGDGVVHGEVHWVSSEHLVQLDEFEGCPELYQRGEISLHDGTRAMAYMMSLEAVRGSSRVDGGSWPPAVSPPRGANF